MPNTRKPILFMLASLLLLFAPGVGDIRWAGFITFLYVGLPWYIVALKDKIESKLSSNQYHEHRFRIHSLTLFIFGLVCAVVGVAIDLFILHQIYTSPSPTAISAALFRLFTGVPFFGFGTYLIYLSLGQVNNET